MMYYPINYISYKKERVLRIRLFLYFLQKFILIGMETMPLLSTQITTDFFSHHSFSNAQLFL